jgi:hypothetical protein
MKRPIIPPVLLTVAIATPLRIIATKNNATVIKEPDIPSWSSAKIVSINTKTCEMKLKIPEVIQTSEPDWFANYE